MNQQWLAGAAVIAAVAFLVWKFIPGRKKGKGHGDCDKC